MFSMSALHSISIKGFKSISHIENLPLGPINVLIGPNGSGKSVQLHRRVLLPQCHPLRASSTIRRAEPGLQNPGRRKGLIRFYTTASKAPPGNRGVNRSALF